MKKTYKCISNIASHGSVADNLTIGCSYLFFMENENFGYTYDDFNKQLWEFFPDPDFGWDALMNHTEIQDRATG